MEKALNIALAANLLRSVENHLTLYQIANG